MVSLKKIAGARAVSVSISSIVVGSVLIACGGNPAPAPAAPPASSETPPTSPVDDAPASSPSPAPTDAAESSASDAGAPESKPAPIVSTEAKDECTPVGVDFEKRARPKLKECYATGKKKDPNLEGTVKIKMTIDVKGKIKNVKVIEKTLPDPVADCMLKVVKATPFPEVDKCWDATITIPITFPTPR